MSEQADSPCSPKRVSFSDRLLQAAQTPLPGALLVKTPSGRLWKENPAYDNMSDAVSYKDAVEAHVTETLDEETCDWVEAELIAAGMLPEGHSEAQKREEVLRAVQLYKRVAARQRQQRQQQGVPVQPPAPVPVQEQQQVKGPPEHGAGETAGSKPAVVQRSERQKKSKKHSSSSSSSDSLSSLSWSGGSSSPSPSSSSSSSSEEGSSRKKKSKKQRQRRPIEWKPQFPVFHRKADEDVFAWVSKMEDALLLARYDLNSKEALQIAQQHLDGSANENWKDDQGRALVKLKNWRAWIASLVADVIGVDGEERLLLELLKHTKQKCIRMWRGWCCAGGVVLRTSTTFGTELW